MSADSSDDDLNQYDAEELAANIRKLEKQLSQQSFQEDFDDSKSLKGGSDVKVVKNTDVVLLNFDLAFKQSSSKFFTYNFKCNKFSKSFTLDLNDPSQKATISCEYGLKDIEELYNLLSPTSKLYSDASLKKLIVKQIYPQEDPSSVLQLILKYSYVLINNSNPEDGSTLHLLDHEVQSDTVNQAEQDEISSLDEEVEHESKVTQHSRRDYSSIAPPRGTKWLKSKEIKMVMKEDQINDDMRKGSMQEAWKEESSRIHRNLTRKQPRKPYSSAKPNKTTRAGGFSMKRKGNKLTGSSNAVRTYADTAVLANEASLNEAIQQGLKDKATAEVRTNYLMKNVNDLRKKENRRVKENRKYKQVMNTAIQAAKLTEQVRSQNLKDRVTRERQLQRAKLAAFPYKNDSSLGRSQPGPHLGPGPLPVRDLALARLSSRRKAQPRSKTLSSASSTVDANAKFSRSYYIVRNAFGRLRAEAKTLDEQYLDFREIFARIDANRDSCIDERELKRYFSELHIDGLGAEELRLIWSHFDANGNGRVDYGEFLSGFYNHRRLLRRLKKKPATEMQMELQSLTTAASPYTLSDSTGTKRVESKAAAPCPKERVAFHLHVKRAKCERRTSTDSRHGYSLRLSRPRCYMVVAVGRFDQVTYSVSEEQRCRALDSFSPEWDQYFVFGKPGFKALKGNEMALIELYDSNVHVSDSDSESDDSADASNAKRKGALEHKLLGEMFINVRQLAQTARDGRGKPTWFRLEHSDDEWQVQLVAELKYYPSGKPFPVSDEPKAEAPALDCSLEESQSGEDGFTDDSESALVSPTPFGYAPQPVVSPTDTIESAEDMQIASIASVWSSASSARSVDVEAVAASDGGRSEEQELMDYEKIRRSKTFFSIVDNSDDSSDGHTVTTFKSRMQSPDDADADMISLPRSSYSSKLAYMQSPAEASYVSQPSRAASHRSKRSSVDPRSPAEASYVSQPSRAASQHDELSSPFDYTDSRYWDRNSKDSPASITTSNTTSSKQKLRQKAKDEIAALLGNRGEKSVLRNEANDVISQLLSTRGIH